MPEQSGTDVAFNGVAPILRVTDFDASVAWYTDVLGFSLDWRDDSFGCITRGEVALMLSQGTQGCNSTWMWIGVSDTDALHAELVRRGARIRVPPTNYPWGSRECHVFDPDGHVLRFGSDLRPGEPMGPWLDEAGLRWQPQPGGGWIQIT